MRKPTNTKVSNPQVQFHLVVAFGVLCGVVALLSFVQFSITRKTMPAESISYEYQMNMAMNPVPDKMSSRADIVKKFGKLTPVYFVTPTTYGPEQYMDLVRLSQTLMHDPAIYWIVVENAPSCTYRIRSLLERTGLLYAHVAVPSKTNNHVNENNLALQGVADLDLDGVVYFSHASNAYDARLFSHLRQVSSVGVFSVGYTNGGDYERCVVDPETEKVAYIASNGDHGDYDRPKQISLSALAFHTNALNADPIAFEQTETKELAETKFVDNMVKSPSELQPLVDNCERIYVWQAHSKIQSTRPLARDLDFTSIQTMV